MRRGGLLAIAIGAAACVPADDAGQPVYGSVAFALSISATHIDLADGWSFSLEHVFAVPRVALAKDGQFSSCSYAEPLRSGHTLVDLVLGTSFDVNEVGAETPCTDLFIEWAPADEQSLGTDPRVSDADRAAYLAAGATAIPAVLVVGSATRGAETKHVSLLFGGVGALSTAGFVLLPVFRCSPTKGAEPVTLAVPNVRQTFHFALDIASLFPGSPPAFGPIAEADANRDGVVTSSELSACLATTIADQIGTGWRLSPGDGVCDESQREGGPPVSPECFLTPEGGTE